MRNEDAARVAAEERRERIAEHDPEPVRSSLRHPEPVDSVVRESEMPAAVTALYASAPESRSQEPATLSGPSFLGLSEGSGGSSSYSYLYEDEQPKSHVAGIVFLLVLAILAGVVYWKWQPLRDYVVNAAMNYSGQGRPAPAAAPVATEPGSSTASSDNAAAQPGQPANPEGLPQQDNGATGEPKVETTQPTDKPTENKDQAAPDSKEPQKTSVPKDERPRSEVGRPSGFQDGKGEGAEDEATAERAKPAAGRAAAPPAGAELVSAAERYLYGRGAPRNCSQALVNFNAAAKQENPRAMSHLGSLYATGQCVALDRVQAYQWFSRALAADRSNTYIEHNLNMLWRDMSSGERAKATQKKMF